ncbi:hypothetical protein FVEN_g12155 [Fusarium venenatum]|nr:hypothetical protein FVEN_g12155 [Fusarium venenatum]
MVQPSLWGWLRMKKPRLLPLDCTILLCLDQSLVTSWDAIIHGTWSGSCIDLSAPWIEQYLFLYSDTVPWVAYASYAGVELKHGKVQHLQIKISTFPFTQLLRTGL